MTRVELAVDLTSPEAVYGVLTVLHARRARLAHLHLTGNTLLIGLGDVSPGLTSQVARRIDVLTVHTRHEQESRN